MSNDTIEQEVLETQVPIVEQPIVEAVAPVVAPVVVPEPEFIYEYQALDEFDRPLGAKQIFKGKDAVEVLGKVAEANKNLIKLSRDLKKKITLGIQEDQDVPTEMKRISGPLAFESKQLSDSEVAEISRDLLDPAKFREASKRLVEAELGAPASTIRESITSQEQRLAQMEAQREAEAFVNNTPDYYICKENFETIGNWMINNGLEPVRENFKYAYEKLNAVGLLLTAPIVREVVSEPTRVAEPTQVESLPVQEEASRITVEEPVATKRTAVKIPSGLTRDAASDVGIPVQRQKITVEEIEKMPSEVYKRRLLTDPSFAKAVNELYAPKPRS